MRPASPATLLLTCAILPCACSSGDSPAASGPSCTPVTETCDGVDQDCDGVPDDGACSAPKTDGAWFLGGTGTDHVRGVAFDAAGNVFVTGAITASADLGKGPVDGAHGYVASLDPSGAVRWSLIWGASNMGYDYGQDVSVGGDMVCASGSFAGTFDFGGGARTAGGYNDAFVVCLDAATGSYRWDRAFGADQSDVTEGVHVTDAGDVVINGVVSAASTDFGGGAVSPAQGAFVARYAKDGAFQWAHVFANAGINFGSKPAVDAAGQVYMTGRFYDSTDFGGGVRASSGAASAFLASFGADGHWRWDHTFGAANTGITLYGASARERGDVVISGELTGSVSLGGPALSSNGGNAMTAFAAAFDASGTFLWQYAPGGAGAMRGYGAAIGPNDQVVLAGAFGGTMKFGDLERTSVGGDDMVAVGLTPEGKYLWDFTVGGSGSDAVNAVAVDGKGRVALGGETWAELTVGSSSHTNAGGDDGALVFLH
ncbi:MAG: putative metal-binding motif-containing protein [Deltaproteobacteria bacterium]|nr:putative metal-binding motif-containing protein [Deltaproteobacteria bacterium]